MAAELPSFDSPQSRATCEMESCGWQSVPLPERSTKRVAVLHVIESHARVYTQTTGRSAPELSGFQRFELTAFTEPPGGPYGS